jgi:type IV secretory pathway VirJ component
MIGLKQHARSAAGVTAALLLAVSLLLGLRPPPPGPASPPIGIDSLARVDDLPLTLVPTAEGSLLAVLLTGDGGWASGDRSMAKAFAQHNVAVVGLSSPRYLAKERTPAQASADLARILEHFLTAWHRERAIVVGYSRGADIGPFMVSRLPGELRDRVALTALLGPGPSASFRFGVFDLLRSHTTSGGLRVAPEVAKLRGLPVLCIYGSSDRGAICSSLAAAGLAHALVRNGGHAIGASEGPPVADEILAAVQGAMAKDELRRSHP